MFQIMKKDLRLKRDSPRNFHRLERMLNSNFIRFFLLNNAKVFYKVIIIIIYFYTGDE